MHSGSLHRRELGAVTRAGRGDDQTGIRPSIDYELLSLVRSAVGRQSVRVQANVTIDDRTCSARDEFDEDFADRQ